MTNESKMAAARKSKRLLRIQIKRFHRRLGMAFALFFIFIAVTGFMLNHSAALNLDQQQIPNMLARGYFTQIETPLGYLLEDKWIYSLDGKLRWNGAKVADCQPTLRSLVVVVDVLALCGDYLLVLTAQGNLIEEISGFAAIDKLGIADIRRLRADLNLSFTEKQIHWPEPRALAEELVAQYLPSVSWTKWLLDIHSGSYFGGMGRLFLDLIALLLIISAVSGLYMGLRSAPK